jgi:hypothetical protein
LVPAGRVRSLITLGTWEEEREPDAVLHVALTDAVLVSILVHLLLPAT